MTVARSLLLFVLAARSEIGGAWLVWQAVAGTAAGHGSAPASWRSGSGQSRRCSLTPTSGASSPRTTASWSPAPLRAKWRWTGSDPTGTTSPGSLLCLAGVAVIMYAPRT